MKNLRIISAFLLTALFCSHTFAQDEDWTKKITPKLVLQAIEIIETDPVGDQFKGAVSIVTNFAEKSDAVSIIVNEKFCPWIKNKNYSEKTTSLLGVFIAGNMKPQLLSGIKKDSPYEGILLTIKTYKVWRKEKLIEELPELEKWSTFNEEQLHKLINQKP